MILFNSMALINRICPLAGDGGAAIREGREREGGDGSAGTGDLALRGFGEEK